MNTPISPIPPRLEVQPAGIHEQMMSLPDGTTLRYTISIPSAYTNDAPSPLILALHYGGQVTSFYGRGMIDFLVEPALADLNAIIVAPDSIAGRWTNETNETAVLHLLDSIITSYNIDTNKTLITGYSMGGMGTWYMAGRHQDRFSAAIPIAGNPQTHTDWQIPLYVIHSRADKVVPITSTEQYVETLQAEGVSVEFVILEGITHYETGRFVEPLRQAIPWIEEIWQ